MSLSSCNDRATVIQFNIIVQVISGLRELFLYASLLPSLSFQCTKPNSILIV